MTAARRLFDEVLQLEEQERARLALALMDSLSPCDARDEAAWIDEIERRARRACATETEGTDVDEAVDRIWHDLEL